MYFTYPSCKEPVEKSSWRGSTFQKNWRWLDGSSHSFKVDRSHFEPDIDSLRVPTGARDDMRCNLPSFCSCVGQVFSIVLCSFFNVKTTAAASAPVALALARLAVSSCFPSWFSSGAFNGSSQQLLPALLTTKKKPSGFGISSCVLEVGKTDEQNYRTEIAVIQLLCQVRQFKRYYRVFEWYFLRGECFEKPGGECQLTWLRSIDDMHGQNYVHIQTHSV